LAAQQLLWTDGRRLMGEPGKFTEFWPRGKMAGEEEANMAERKAAGGALALPALIVGSIAIGFSPIFVRLSELGPIATGFYRLFLALPLLWLWLLREGGAAKRETSWLPMAVPGILFAGDIFFWHWSIVTTTVANATLFANFAPVIVALGAWIFLRERITPLFIVGLLLSIAGAALLVKGSATLGTRYVLGDFLGAVTACFFGSYMVAVARLRDRHGAAAIMFCSSAVTAVLLLGATLAAGESLLPASASGFLALLALAWISQAMGQGLIAHALGHLPASFSALVILIEPLTAAILGWIWLGEALGPWQGIGGIIVLAGILVAQRASRDARPRSNAPHIFQRFRQDGVDQADEIN
jgi:drug/metabolite transporter (DMT)-like permease